MTQEIDAVKGSVAMTNKRRKLDELKDKMKYDLSEMKKKRKML